MKPKVSIIKYCICFQFEKLHRYVFDNCYICYGDEKYKPLTLFQKGALIVYDLIGKIVYPDFREYLNWWNIENKTKYIRYKKY